MLTEVERLQGRLACLNDELSLIVELLALDGDGRNRISDLCCDAKVDIRNKSEDLDRLRETYCSDPSKVDREASALATTCAPLMAMEIAALDLFVETLAIAERVEGEDHDFVKGALQTARSAYNTHVSFVRSALTRQGRDLVTFAQFCHTDPRTSASRDACNQLANNELPQLRARVTEQHSN